MPSPHPVSSHFQAAASRLGAQFAKDLAALAVSAAGSEAGPLPHDTTSGFCNVWVAALSHTPSKHSRPLASSPQHARIFAARLLGAPIWPALGRTAPSHCGSCFAAVAPPRARASGPTKVLDDYGEHALCCRNSGVAAGIRYRHNATVRDLADLSAMFGQGGVYHDGPIFTFGRKQRPADWLEQDPRRPAGNANDFTMGCDSVRSAAAREQMKNDKYAPQLAFHPQLSFTPFGVTTRGTLGPAAQGKLALWIRSLAAESARLRLPTSQCRDMVLTSVARCITNAVVDQIAQWDASQRCVAPGKHTARRRPH